MSKVPPPVCPFCSKQAVLKTGASHYRRRDKVIQVETQFWECPSDCVGPDGERPFQFHDPALLKSNDEAAKAAWRKAYGEDMPSASKPGRKTEEPRKYRIQVLLTEEETKALDRSRGSLSRSEHLRRRAFGDEDEKSSKLLQDAVTQMAALFTVSLFKDSDEKGRLGRFRLHGEMKWPENLTRHLQARVRSLGEIRSTLDITAPQDTSSDELYGFIAKFRNNWRQGNTPTHLEAGRLRADFKLDPWSKEAGHEALNELSDSLKMLMMCWMAMPGMAATKPKE